VKDIVSGKVDLEEVDRKEKELIERREKEAELKKRREEEKKRLEEEKLQRGTEGKGLGKTYISFCKYCFTEYQIQIDKCNKCGKDTISREVF
jgi:hypothetical protein